MSSFASSLPKPRSLRPVALALWVAFLAGLLGADAWFHHGDKTPHPALEAEVSVGPTPLPLVVGVDPSDLALPAAPDAALEQTTTEGKLPIISSDGRAPLAVYGYPFDQTDVRPRVSVVLMGVGLEAAEVTAAIHSLPGAVGLAMSAYTPNLAQTLTQARAAGHETLITIPADGVDENAYDPGPNALRHTLSLDENMQRLHLFMAQGTGYAGLMIDPSTSLLDKADQADALIQEAKTRGLALVSMNADFVERGAKEGSPVVEAVVQLDPMQSPAALDAALAEVEQRARERGAAVVIAPPYPLVLDRLTQWLPQLAPHGLALAPVSALAVLPKPVSNPHP